MARQAPVLLVVLLGLLLTTAPASAQFPTGDRLPIEEVSPADIFRACELPIESEVEDGIVAPATLEGVGVSGKWAYERTSVGVLRNPSLLTDTGRIDLWISNDTAEANLGILHDISAVFYITGEAARNDALEATVMVRARGHYVPSKGILCLLGCQESLLPNFYSAADQNINFTGMAGGGGGGYDELVDEPEGPEPDENVEAGVANPLPISQELETQCRTRTVLHFTLKENGESEVSGRLESLRHPGEGPFFSPIVITASSGEIASQVLWFQMEMVIESVTCALQAACVAYQISQVRRFADGAFVSLTMISVQIFVYAFYWVRSLYYPLRYLNSEVLIYFISDVANIPRFVEFIIFALYVALAIMVDSKRRKGMKVKPSAQGTASAADVEGATLLTRSTPGEGAASGPGLAERQLAIFMWPVYIVVGIIMWISYDFDSFLRVCTFLFLVPQLVVNYVWNLSETQQRGVSVVYAVGSTFIQMAWLAYEVLRPQLMGYDAFFAFPHAWYWSSMVLMVAQLVAFIFQRIKGARWEKNLDPYAAKTPQGTELGQTSSTATVEP